MRYANLYRNIANWYLYPLHKFGLKTGETLNFETREGYSIEVPKSLIREFKEIFMTEAYLKGFPRFDFSEIRTVVDIGANAGFFSLFSLQRFPNAKVFSYEPFPPNFRLLERQKNANAQRDFFPFRKAVSGSKGKLTFYSNKASDFSTCASLVPNEERNISLDVEAITLADVFELNKISQIDLLKMDTEGAEYETLFSCPDDVLSKVRRICMEVHHIPENGYDVSKLVKFLESKGFATRYEGTGPLWILWTWRPSVH